MGKKTQQNFLYIDVSKVQKEKPQTCALSPSKSLSLSLSLSLSYVLYKSVCVCVFKWGTHLLYLYSFFHLNFSLTSRPQQTYWADFT